MSEERRAFNLEMAQSLGRIEGKLDSLAGPEGRVTKLEASQTRQWWLTACIGPALAIAHSVAKKLGVQI
jgi:hypothetical protein